MRSRHACVLLLTTFAVGALGACAPSAPSSEVAPVDDPNTSAPTMGTPDVEPDQPNGNGQPSLSLPSLPVGGDSVPVEGSPGLQCASVSWIVDPAGPAALRGGFSVTITGVATDPPDFRLSRQTCVEGTPSCFGYTFSADSGNPACVVAAWARRPGASAALVLSGTVHCSQLPLAACRDFVTAALQVPGQVSLTDETTPAEETSDSASPTPAQDDSTSPSPADESSTQDG